MKLATLEELVRSFDSRGVRFIVVGGLAVSAHGYVRNTVDVDLVIALDPDNIRAAFEALRAVDYRPGVPITAEQFADRPLRESWIRDKGMVVLSFWSDHHRETPVDVFVTEPFDFAREYSAGLIQELAPGLSLRFPTLDTLIDMKLKAGRGKDKIDVEYLIKARDA
jgi:hypothetical protein